MKINRFLNTVWWARHELALAGDSPSPPDNPRPRVQRARIVQVDPAHQALTVHRWLQPGQLVWHWDATTQVFWNRQPASARDLAEGERVRVVLGRSKDGIVAREIRILSRAKPGCCTALE